MKYQLSIQDGRQISKILPRRCIAIKFFVISTTNSGDFPGIIEIAFFVYDEVHTQKNNCLYRELRNRRYIRYGVFKKLHDNQTPAKCQTGDKRGHPILCQVSG